MTQNQEIIVRDCIRNIQAGRSIQKNQQVVIDYYDRYIHKIIRKYAPKTKQTDVNYDDLYQCGIIGLLESINSFNLNKGVKFITYATYKMTSQISKETNKGRLFINKTPASEDGVYRELLNKKVHYETEVLKESDIKGTTLNKIDLAALNRVYRPHYDYNNTEYEEAITQDSIDEHVNINIDYGKVIKKVYDYLDGDNKIVFEELYLKEKDSAPVSNIAQCKKYIKCIFEHPCVGLYEV